jgi:hypothetical protein
LFFAPGHHKLPHASVNALTVGRQDGEALKYSVHHYGTAHGQAFGPFALDAILDFCRHLKILLEGRSGSEEGPLYLTTTPGDSAAHTNASVLIGAYLVLCENWSVKAITNCLGIQDAARKFPCSWGKRDCQASTWIMTVESCWEGLHMAWQHGWVDPQFLCDDIVSSKYRNMVAIYDAAWIVPGKILVAADPVTTAADPNPETFSEIWHSTNELASPRRSRKQSQPSPRRLVSGRIKSSQGDLDEPKFEETASTNCSECGSLGSVETVCKEFATTESTCLQLNKSVAFAEFAQDCGVKLVIRTNYSNEPGMPLPSYDARKWSEFDIKHENIRYVDKLGGLPDAKSVASLLLAVSCMDDESLGAVLVHCKGGFGRSVVLACCLAIHRYDVPGSALLGWARIARPGAVTTVQQEQFLMSLRGRADVLSLAAKSGSQSEIFRGQDYAPKTKCMAGCMVQ